MSSSILLADEAGLARRNVRHNAVALGADFALFLVGLAFASQSTILPAFAAHLGAPNVVIGAIPAVMTLGWFLPSLFAAGHTESLARKLPFVMRFTLWERIPFLALALIAFFVATPAPAVALAALLLLLLIVTGTGGVLMPAWMDIVGRAIPTTLRGRFFGVANVLGSAGGLVGSLGTAYFLARVPAPASYGVCFLCAALCMGLSYVALALVREPAAAATVPRQPMGAYLRRIPGLLARDRNLSWFLVARAFASIGTMAGGFYTVYALRAWEAPAWWVATFTSVLLAGQIAGNLVFGFLADRAGHRLVLISGTLIGVAANVLALVAPSVGVFSAVFALSGIQMAAVSVSGLNVMLEFAPGAEERPTYIGLGTTLMAPVFFAAPLVAGVMADGLAFRGSLPPPPRAASSAWAFSSPVCTIRGRGESHDGRRNHDRGIGVSLGNRYGFPSIGLDEASPSLSWADTARRARPAGGPRGAGSGRAQPAALSKELIARGKYVFGVAAGCGCHTEPKKVATELNAGGRKYEGPFGTVYSTNITPDPETGIGKWTDDQIITAIRAGRRPNGERLIPVHPYPTFNGMAEEDLRAVVAYLRSVPPVRRANTPKKISVPMFESVFLPAWLAAFAPRETPPATAPDVGAGSRRVPRACRRSLR